MEPFYVAIITPVIHYCMGGLEITREGEVYNSKREVIEGLYCAGEVAGGVHGNNRLGGNSLLDCVVFGRVTGRAAMQYALGDQVRQVDLKSLVPEEAAATKELAAPATASAAAAKFTM